jgi:hypothetical protein
MNCYAHHEGTATQTDFFEPGLCDLTPFCHSQAEYVNDLLQLTLNAKAARKIGFLIEGTGRA